MGIALGRVKSIQIDLDLRAAFFERLNDAP
jgi:hypothetical protein